MEKTFTILDLQQYLQEINFLEKKLPAKIQAGHEPGITAVQNLLRYSSALNILKTSTAGTIFQLTN